MTVAERLRAEGHDVAFAGTPEGLEARLVPEAGVTFFGVRAKGFDRARPHTLITSTVTILGSLVRARRLIRQWDADVVFGFGGYVSLPVGFAALTRRVPLVLHEQNSVPGLANKVLSRWARAVGVTYEGSIAHLAHPDRAVLTGNPVRAAVLEADRTRGRRALGLAEDATVLLVFGGSRGARHLNERLAALAPTLTRLPSLQVVHVAGRIEAASVAERIASAIEAPEGRYEVVDYIDDMGDAIAAADLVVARAGATSIAEITAIGRASVLVPYPYATDDHQTLNARAVADAGGALVFADADIDGAEFSDAIVDLLDNVSRREEMAAAAAALGRRDADQRVAQLALDAGREETR